MAAKGGREKIKLESTAGTGHFYTTAKNKKTTPEKLEFMKFDPKARKHVLYKEIKLKYAAATGGNVHRHSGSPLESPPSAGFFHGPIRPRSRSIGSRCASRPRNTR